MPTFTYTFWLFLSSFAQKTPIKRKITVFIDDGRRTSFSKERKIGECEASNKMNSVRKN